MHTQASIHNICMGNLACRGSGKEMLTVSSKHQDSPPPLPSPRRVPSPLVVTSTYTAGAGNNLTHFQVEVFLQTVPSLSGLHATVESFRTLTILR